MEMIIGGAYQGKTDYAKEKYPELGNLMPRDVIARGSI